MSLPRPWLAALFICVVSSALAGCASFRDGGPAPGASWPLTPPSAPATASVTVTAESYVNGSAQNPSATIPKWRDAIAGECRGSGLFTSVADGGAADRMMEFHVVDRGDASMPLAVVCGLTFFIVPCKATDEMTLRMVVKDRAGATLGTYERSETSVTWMELFLIFVMPFNYPPSEFKALFQDLTRATLADARAAGVL